MFALVKHTMPLARAYFRPVQDQQTSRSYFPQVISSQPAPQPEMIIGPPSTPWLEKDLLEGTQRLRGGGVECVCCGGGDNSQQLSPLEPQPELADNENVRRAALSISPAHQASERSRDRHQTLPSKLAANKSNLITSSWGSPSTLEGAIDYGGGIMQNPAFPPSVHIAGGSRKGAGGPPPVTAPFMKD
ncbi:unnamed protein product [Rhizoctonia solani]|uniref:Uncharacterized protein n=1 Tax=Rhizoctonia solani TaxID=456999 RepID=A0A8H3E9X8_9AGAM|nr:unnamed protein product [Rhizoctonia solani]